MNRRDDQEFVAETTRRVPDIHDLFAEGSRSEDLVEVIQKRMKTDPDMSRLIEYVKHVLDTADGIDRIADRIPVVGQDIKRITASARAAVRNVLSRSENLFRRLTAEALTDGLTGLFNRRHFSAYLENAVFFAKRYGLPLSLIMIDVDHFKDVNDCYGHFTGDMVLMGLADRMRKSFPRGSDVKGRIGGEEFAVVLPQTSAEEALVVVNRFLEEVTSTPFGLGQLKISVSAGVADFDPATMLTADELVRIADDNLYILKGKRPDKYGVTADRRGGCSLNGEYLDRETLGKRAEAISSLRPRRDPQM